MTMNNFCYTHAMRTRHKSLKIALSIWTTDQDCYLIENSSMSIDELKIQLPFSEDEIWERKRLLGLNRRQRQMRKMI